MAPSQGYRDWVKAGKPYNLITPAKALQRNLRRHGLTVYDYPDDGHQQATKPEDHTPYSVTGWPGENRRWNARGLDIMPRSSSYAHRKENADIARQIIRDKDAGVPGTEWIKYLNWTDEDGNCFHVSWQPTKAVRSSTDRNHIHVSGRSDCDSDTRAETYDPFQRMQGGGQPAPVNGGDMAVIAKDTTTGRHYLCFLGGFKSYPIDPNQLPHIKYLAQQGAFSLARQRNGQDDAEWEGGGWIRKGWSEPVFGPLDTTTSVEFPVSAVDQLVSQVSAKVEETLAELRADVQAAKAAAVANLSQAERDQLGE